MNSDSRPDSVLDEGENTNEALDPPPNIINGSSTKENSEDKLDSSSSNCNNGNNNSSTAIVIATDAQNIHRHTNEKEISAEEESSNPSQTTTETNEENIPHPSDQVIPSTVVAPTTGTITPSSSTVLAPLANVATAAPIVQVPSSEDNSLNNNNNNKEPQTQLETAIPPEENPRNSSYLPKEQEMLTKIANMKQEIIVGSGAPPSSQHQQQQQQSMNPIDYSPPKEIYIKKEPTDDSMDAACNQNSNEPQDLKVKIEIKSEIKGGVHMNDGSGNDMPPGGIPISSATGEQKFIGNSHPQSFEGHIKFGNVGEMKYPPPNEMDMKYNVNEQPPPPHSMKYSQDGPPPSLKFPIDMKYPPPQHCDPLKYPPPQDLVNKYEMKYLEATKHQYPPGELSSKGYHSDPIKIPDIKSYHQDAVKFSSDNASTLKSYPPIPTDPLKFGATDGSNKGHFLPEPPPHHQLSRSPYDTSIMMKYGDPMAKYGGIPPPLPPHGQPQDLKYPPSDAGLKSYHGENLIKGSPYTSGGGTTDSQSSSKYPPPGSPIDASARTTPNQDSQGSNSNSQSHFHSPHPSQNPSPIIPQVQSHPGLHSQNLIVSHPGLPQSSLHPVVSHSLVSTSSSPATTVPNSSLQSSTSMLMPPSISTSVSSISGHVGSIPSSIHHQLPPPPGSSSHLPPLHRPHQDIPPSIHHPSAIPLSLHSHGIPPPTGHGPSAHGGRSPSPAPPQRHESGNNNSSSALNQRETNQQHSHRSSPLTGLSSNAIIGHPLPLHLGGAGPLPLAHPHHPSHLAMPPAIPMGATPISLIGSSAMGAISEPSSGGRRTPQQPVTSSVSSGLSTATAPVSAFSRASPSVQNSSSLHNNSSHRSSSPATSSGNLSRQSPLHPVPQSPLGHHPSASALSAAAAAVAERDRHALMRQQSPHMTPPPVSSASALMASPLSKMYGPQSQRGLGSSPPPHHLRPGASPPVIRHPQMPLPLPLIGPGAGIPPMSVHPAQSPYPHHLLHPSMFYGHHHPFNSPYPYHPYGPGFAAAASYMKPPPPTGPLEPAAVLPHHQSMSSTRPEENTSHSDKQLNNSQNSQHKVILCWKISIFSIT